MTAQPATNIPGVTDYILASPEHAAYMHHFSARTQATYDEWHVAAMAEVLAGQRSVASLRIWVAYAQKLITKD